MATNFADDFARDFARWPRHGGANYNWSSSDSTRDLPGPMAQTEFLLDWFEQRIVWLDEWLGE